MIILLYRDDKSPSFRIYHNPCDVSIDLESKRVIILKDATVVDEYVLVRYPKVTWTDETKSDLEVLVKIIVKDVPKYG